MPGDATVVTPAHRPAVKDEVAAVRTALEEPVVGRPLRELVPAGKVAISVCDATRPQPRRPMLVQSLRPGGVVPPDDVVVLIATGTSASTEAQRREMLGEEVMRRWRVVDHDARDGASLDHLGSIDGVPVFLNRAWVEAEVRITTGFVEPHFFAGFSGGPKMVAPGLAGLETVLELHSTPASPTPARRSGCRGEPGPRSHPGDRGGDGGHFAIDVLIDEANGSRSVRWAGAGDACRIACRTAREAAMQPVRGPFDLVITTNSGYPLDRNLYQSVKGMAAAARSSPGGTIICAAECRERTARGWLIRPAPARRAVDRGGCQQDPRGGSDDP